MFAILIRRAPLSVLRRALLERKTGGACLHPDLAAPLARRCSVESGAALDGAVAVSSEPLSFRSAFADALDAAAPAWLPRERTTLLDVLQLS